jgi:dihydrodipicolinate reductase
MEAIVGDDLFHQFGVEWQRQTDEYLVGFAQRPPTGQASTPAIVEMQRRQIVATIGFNETATAQARTMIRLTQWIIALTVVLGVIAVLQLLAMLK